MSVALSEISDTVKPGDTFNKILLRHHISRQSINQVNAEIHNLTPLSKLAPGDTVKFKHDEHSRKLMSCAIYSSKPYILNNYGQSYRIHPLSSNDNVTIITTHTQDKTHNKHWSIAQRACQQAFPGKQGVIQAAFTNDRLNSLKLIQDDQVRYAFINHQANTFVDENLKTIVPIFSRTPTNFTRISSPFNPNRLHPISKKVKPHNGVDLAAPINTPIWAAASGVVTHKSSDTGYGNMLIIKHDNGIETYYAHMNKFHRNIDVGTKVSAFETIGYVGSTGHSTGPHLHFEARHQNIAYDPLTIQIPLKTKEKVVATFYF